MKRQWFTAGMIAMGLSSLVVIGVRAEEKDKDKEANEVKVTVDQLPSAVKETLMKEVGDGKISDIDKETDDGKTVYEADAVIGGTNYEIKIAEDGKMISKKVDNEDNEKKDADKKKN